MSGDRIVLGAPLVNGVFECGDVVTFGFTGSLVVVVGVDTKTGALEVHHATLLRRLAAWIWRNWGRR